MHACRFSTLRGPIGAKLGPIGLGTMASGQEMQDVADRIGCAVGSVAAYVGLLKEGFRRQDDDARASAILIRKLLSVLDRQNASMVGMRPFTPDQPQTRMDDIVITSAEKLMLWFRAHPKAESRQIVAYFNDIFNFMNTCTSNESMWMGLEGDPRRIATPPKAPDRPRSPDKKYTGNRSSRVDSLMDLPASANVDATVRAEDSLLSSVSVWRTPPSEGRWVDIGATVDEIALPSSTQRQYRGNKITIAYGREAVEDGLDEAWRAESARSRKRMQAKSDVDSESGDSDADETPRNWELLLSGLDSLDPGSK